MSAVRNLTPHAVAIAGGVTYAPDPAGPARVTATFAGADRLGDGTPLLRAAYGPVQGLPAAEPGTWLIVSRAVAAACPGRGDLLVPADLVRDAAGAVVGCRGLETLA